MAKIAETDLIINADGSVYHLNLQPHHLADRIIAVGDPGRVFQVSKHFDKIEFDIRKREFITQTGIFQGKRLSVISTGIGTDNVEIFFNEIDALVNIELEKRTARKKKKKLSIVRIGTSGGLQPDIPLGAHLASQTGIGLDNLLGFYQWKMNDKEESLVRGIRRTARLAFTPYMASASTRLLKTLAFDMLKGNTLTAPGFYAPQGRTLRLPLRYNDLLDDLTRFKQGAFRLTNFEMETSAYYALGKLLGHEVLSLNVIIAQRAHKRFLSEHRKTMDDLIVKTLERL